MSQALQLRLAIEVRVTTEAKKLRLGFPLRVGLLHFAIEASVTIEALNCTLISQRNYKNILIEVLYDNTTPLYSAIPVATLH